MKIRQLRLQAGQTMIEILIVTVIVASVLTAIAAGLSMSTKNAAENKNLSIATSYAQEVLELFYKERYNLGWNAFQSGLSSGVYCFNTLPQNSTELLNLSAGECGVGEVITGTNYQREATLTVGADEVQVVSRVFWLDGSKEKQVLVEQSFQDI